MTPKQLRAAPLTWESLEAVIEAFWIQEARRAEAGATRTAEQGVSELCQVLSACFDGRNKPVENDTANSAVNVLKGPLSRDSVALIKAFRRLGPGNLSGWRLTEALGLNLTP